MAARQVARNEANLACCALRMWLMSDGRNTAGGYNREHGDGEPRRYVDELMPAIDRY